METVTILNEYKKPDKNEVNKDDDVIVVDIMVTV